MRSRADGFPRLFRYTGKGIFDKLLSVQNRSIMVSRFRLPAKVLALAALGFPQLAAAQGFTSATVLAWSEAEQDSYFSTSVGMAGIVAMQTGRHDAAVTCINNWYWPNGGSEHSAQNDTIRTVMRSLPDVHPQAVIMAVIERECGSFSLS